jgi:hypothetical protein
MRTNAARTFAHIQTHNGAQAYPHLTAEQRLRRSVMSCLLWESEFYEDGQAIAERIAEAASAVSPDTLARVAIEARSEQHLRHVPLLLCVELARRGGKLVGDTIAQVIQRADELPEFLSLYWKANPPSGKDARGLPINAALAKQVKRGLGLAFQKFDAYQIAKYDRANAIRLRDVLFLTHAKPKDEAQAATWKALVDGTLPSPDTWEVALSAGGDKRAEFTRLLTERKLGYLALLRNLRNMVDAGVDAGLIRDAIVARKGGAERVLPFRYVAAARACPQMEPAIDQALSEAISGLPILSGKTVVLVDVSGSMAERLSAKSDLTRMDAASALASIIHGDIRMFSFSDKVVEVPPRRGMVGIDALLHSQPHNDTALFDAVAVINEHIPYDRLIVITDEQANGAAMLFSQRRMAGHLTALPTPRAGALGYMVNVASAKNGVGYGAWRHIDGFSENVIRWIVESERDAR